MNYQKMRDHGGNLADACARLGGAAEDWLDLFTGINPVAYPVGDLAPSVWSRLPDAAAFAAAKAAARFAYGIRDGVDVVAGAGASALIGMMPRLARTGVVAIPGPTYNEHAAVFRAAGRIREMLWPPTVSGPALELGDRALGDEHLAEATRVRVTADAVGWRLVGEAGLFATFETPDAAAARDRLAGARIWSRIFPYSPFWLWHGCRAVLRAGSVWPLRWRLRCWRWR